MAEQEGAAAGPGVRHDCQMARVCLQGRRHELYLRSSLALTDLDRLSDFLRTAEARRETARGEAGGRLIVVHTVLSRHHQVIPRRSPPALGR